MIKLPELSSTHNVVTESAYDILSSNIDNLYTTLGTVTDYVSAAQQQGEIAAISAANVAVSSMSVVGSHLDTILSTENTIKEISSDLVNSTNTINEYDARLQTTEDTLGRYLEYSQNILKNFETFDINTALTSDNVGIVSSRYYDDAPYTIRSTGIRTGGIITSYRFHETGEIPPCSGATRYININTLSATDYCWLSQSGCPALNQSMIVSIYARGTGKINLYANATWCSDFTVTTEWKRYTYVITKYNASHIGNHAGISFRAHKGSNVDFCGFQFEIGTAATTYNPISNNGVPSNNLIAVNCDVKNVTTYSITTSSLVTNTTPVQLVNPNDTSDYPLVYIENDLIKPCCKLVGIKGLGSEFYYNCDQYYHYFTNNDATYVYDDTCTFVNVLSGTPINDYAQTWWYHDAPHCFANYATNNNKKTIILHRNTYGADGGKYKILIRDLPTNTIVSRYVCPTHKTVSDGEYYVGQETKYGLCTVNELTQHFIIFSTLYQAQYTYDENNVYVTSAAVFQSNGYIVLNDEGYFTKYNSETSSWDESSEFEYSYFHKMESAIQKTWLGGMGQINNIVWFRNTSRTRTPTDMQRVTWVVHTTQTSADNGVWAFDEYDKLIPVPGKTNATDGSYNPNTGIIRLDNSVSSTKVTSPYAKTVSYRLAPYFIQAATQPDTVGEWYSCVASLTTGRWTYRLSKNVQTGQLTSYVEGNGAYILGRDGVVAASVDMTNDNKGRILTTDGGNYGGAGTVGLAWSNKFIATNNPFIQIPIKTSGGSIYQSSAGLRSVRLPNAKYVNINNACGYSPPWRGGFVTTV